MRRLVPVALILAASGVAAYHGEHQPASRADGRLEGTWVIEAVRRDGHPDPDPVGGVVTFAGRSVTFSPQPGVVAVLNAPAAANRPSAALFS